MTQLLTTNTVYYYHNSAIRRYRQYIHKQRDVTHDVQQYDVTYSEQQCGVTYNDETSGTGVVEVKAAVAADVRFGDDIKAS